MKKYLLILCFFIFAVTLFSASNLWTNDKNYKQILTVDSIISYSPSIVIFKYNDDNTTGYYFSDCAQYSHMFNIYPVFQTGFLINYRWLWGLQTFVLSSMFRTIGFNFDIYSLSLDISFCDIGFSWYKYEWNKSITGRNNQWCTLISPITASVSYRIRLHENIDIMLNLGYSMQMIINNKIIFPNSNVDASLFMDNVFNMGIGFRIYTRNFKE